ncbi:MULTISPECIES: VanW family protein [Terrisporobacter]|nr:MULTISPECIES: VanW family protein [Terrisporobacter]MCC3668106.1 VanW family protein [Terrisporobacter mayombei]MDU6983005.1 VanW family protein [Terrisporobacter othiniensis]MDY3375170.1 VanW family protein [Terrisporobacter othiniensis]
MERNDDNNDIIRKARQKAKAEQKKESKEKLTEEEKDDVVKADNADNKEEIGEKKEEEKVEVIKEENEDKEIITQKDVFNDKEDVNSKELDNNKEEIIEEKEEKNKKSSKKQKKIYIGIICFFLLIGIMYFGAKRYDNLVYPDITLYEEDVSRLDKNELDEKINAIVDNINNNKIIVKVDDKEYEVLVSDIIEELDVKKVENEIMSYGKDKTFLEQFGLIYLSVGRNYNFNIKIDKNYLQEQVKKIYADTHIAPIEPTFEMNGDNLNIIKGKNGKSIDDKKLMNDIIEKINSNEVGKTDIVIKEQYKTIKPKINDKDLKGVDYKISSATTYFGGTGYNRGLNIANATNKIDGTLLMPGDEFSYEDKVSPVELNNGYYMAPVIVNGSHKDAPGGGVCQVSTTLYNAELKAGIIPTERYNHSKSVSYVQRGLDATLATGSKNLRFKNPYDYPIYIHAYTVGGQVTVEFWSNKSVLDGKKYTPVSFVKGNVANTYLYGYNINGELIYKKFIDTSIYR